MSIGKMTNVHIRSIRWPYITLLVQRITHANIHLLPTH